MEFNQDNIEQWYEYKNKMMQNYTKMLVDFMTPEGDFFEFLSEKQFKEIHQLGDGVFDLYNIPKEEWEESYHKDHLMKSSFERKKKMCDKILEYIQNSAVKPTKSNVSSKYAKI